MLISLSIENYALIDKLTIDFSKGFSVITGETGAGKSILLGALSLIVGGRADKQVLNNPDKKCVIEGHFDISTYLLKEFFDRNELDYEDIVILRREINKQGKSRAFINDTPVRLPIIKEIGEKLVDIHSQNNTLTLNNSDVQMTVVDNYSGHQEILLEYRKVFKQYQLLKVVLDELIERNSQAKVDHDYYQFLFDELESANLNEGEQEQIEEELEIQNHAESIKSGLLQAVNILQDNEINIIDQLRSLSQQLSKSAQHHKAADKLSGRLNSSLIELEDIASEMEGVSEEVLYSPHRIEELTDRLNIIYELQQKHRVSTLLELLQKQEELENRLQGMLSLEDEIESSKKEILKLQNRLSEIAKKLTENRKKSSPYIEKEIRNTLKSLGMYDADFKVEIRDLDRFSIDGLDAIKFLFSANKGVAVQEMSKIASGGEMSRLMLAVKSLIAKKNLLPTIIFDEIDSGVSGDIAGRVGEIMKKMAKAMQVIAITHLPQIAGKSDNHFFVYKDKNGEKTYSRMRLLENEDKIEEIAKMLSDNKISNAALQTAKELIKN
ncbi:MAG: DNA repair protein RecN [Bacteroidota bacterium]|nr:DNA repair protein RecN [Bacteroidota bacterium]